MSIHLPLIYSVNSLYTQTIFHISYSTFNFFDDFSIINSGYNTFLPLCKLFGFEVADLLRDASIGTYTFGYFHCRFPTNAKDVILI